MGILHFCLIYFILQLVSVNSTKKPVPYVHKKPSSRYDNPNYVRDRMRAIGKLLMPEEFVKNLTGHRPFHPAWMDYCAPYHCNDYHKTACGLNRANMKFKWFQSACHIILNNMCSAFRGTLKYDVVDTKHCLTYVMFLRQGCDVNCTDVSYKPICAMSVTDYHTVLFKNECALQTANCQPATLYEYKKVEMEVCTIMRFLKLDNERYNPKKNE